MKWWRKATRAIIIIIIIRKIKRTSIWLHFLLPIFLLYLLTGHAFSNTARLKRLVMRTTSRNDYSFERWVCHPNSILYTCIIIINVQNNKFHEWSILSNQIAFKYIKWLTQTIYFDTKHLYSILYIINVNIHLHSQVRK